MTTPYSMIRDINGYNGFGLPLSDSTFNSYLTAGTNETLTVPSDNSVGITSGNPRHKFVARLVFTPGKQIFVAINQEAFFTASGPFDVTHSAQFTQNELILVNAGDVINVKTPDSGCTVTVSFYALIS